MSRKGISRKRRMRHGRLERLSRSATLLGWLAARVTALTGTGASTTFTADNSANELTATDHGFELGEGPMKLVTIGTLPAGLSASTLYWVIPLDDDTFQLATSRLAAANGDAVAFTSDGSGTLNIARSADTNSAIREWNRGGHKPERLNAISDIDSL